MEQNNLDNNVDSNVPNNAVNNVEANMQNNIAGNVDNSNVVHEEGQSNNVVVNTPQMDPETAEFMSHGMYKIDEIVEALDKRDSTKEYIGNISSEIKRFTSELKQQKSKLESDINAEVKKQQIAATAQEDEELANAKSALKEEKTKRSRAKSKGIKDRIAFETKDLVEENVNTHREIRKMLSDNGLPGYCDSKWFFTMYASNGIIEVLIKLSVFIISLFAVPGIILFIADPWWLWKMIWWAVIDAVFIMIYVTIYLFTKDKDNGTLEEVRMQRYKISDNDKKIMEIKKSINNDEDESQYNLGEFDVEIKKYEDQINELTSVRNEKAKYFEENTKAEIINEMRADAQPAFDEKQNTIDYKQAEYEEQKKLLEQMNNDIVMKYQRFMGDKYTSRNNLNKIKQLLESNQATNIGEALNIIKNGQ